MKHAACQHCNTRLNQPRQLALTSSCQTLDKAVCIIQAMLDDVCHGVTSRASCQTLDKAVCIIQAMLYDVCYGVETSRQCLQALPILSAEMQLFLLHVKQPHMSSCYNAEERPIEALYIVKEVSRQGQTFSSIRGFTIIL